jgi:murein DD-endopeptidase MepM/ murein hydrolase activator NlpD
MEPNIRKPFLAEYPITMKFGAIPDWYTKITGYPHNGIDFAMNVGKEILAAAKGMICYADNVPDSDGMGINIRHGWGISQYWHLSKLTARITEEVNRGDLIGYSGASGWATGPHLHFGIKRFDKLDNGMRGWVDPALYFDEPLPPIQIPHVNPRVYVVLPGDSLWKIAAKIYGDGKYWPKIYEQNKDKISNPNIIRAFMVLKIN